MTHKLVKPTYAVAISHAQRHVSGPNKGKDLIRVVLVGADDAVFISQPVKLTVEDYYYEDGHASVVPGDALIILLEADSLVEPYENDRWWYATGHAVARAVDVLEPPTF